MSAPTSASPATSPPGSAARQPAAAVPVQDGLPLPQRYWAMAAMTVALIMAVLDGVVANIALPTIQREFAVDAASAIWVVNAYQMAVTVALFPLASLGDIVGYRRVYGVGLAVFTVASLGCALAPNLPVLTIARVLQGLGGAGIMSVNLALVRHIYPSTHLGRGVGYNAMIVAVSSAAGPSLAALILSAASWPWLFAVNVPLGLAALAVASKAMPVSNPAGHRFDWLSAALNAGTLGLLIVGFKGIDGSQPAWQVAAELAGALALGVTLVRRELSQTTPLLPVDLLRRPVFALTVVTSVCSFAAQNIAFVSLPFFFEDVLGRSQAESGLLMTPWPLMVALVAPITGRLADRYDASRLASVGLGLFACGLALMALLPHDPTVADAAWRMALAGFGFGLFQTPNNKVLVSSAPKERSGGASGIQSTGRLLGQTLGAAAVGLTFTALGKADGTVAVLWLAAGLCLVACVVGALRGRPAH
ncbi:MFS transporter [Azospirillum picis]|uniref:DHA2 family multidrug resistance protein-like MFS transporter n=1 Tax=Azospirillum picis TaxID=488438 RepID=A0ABU0MHC5_9PROT|nr:MFS transporter [Azospirillum picis]MBP2298898.1 DHA2 family multidrug resistance protein-like MFS transporter [Azospirillum picis]MDQ0532860.1 DHA2 family multidrug resistance protein-like MFS transporter [Azospirillum picis]